MPSVRLTAFTQPTMTNIAKNQIDNPVDLEADVPEWNVKIAGQIPVPAQQRQIRARRRQRKASFWMAVRPRFRLYLTFMKSSRKPMTPKTSANAST